MEDVKITVKGVTSIAKTDDNFICVTLDGWPLAKCNYNQCPWGKLERLRFSICMAEEHQKSHECETPTVAVETTDRGMFSFLGKKEEEKPQEEVIVTEFEKECFYAVFEEEIHKVIVDNHLFKPGERIAIGASGGKRILDPTSFDLPQDSMVLAYVLSELNLRHNYGLHLFLLSVDEGITGYRDDSLETVKRNEVQALDRGAAMLKADRLCTEHNADDIAETILLNILRGDIARSLTCDSKLIPLHLLLELASVGTYSEPNY
ncbi:hypothetical protein HHK36_010398 [Tetracentron sinense]|uniref:Uncharacterized protein n=1 Tax=Tetracentron sinense TaxID=13715 RepID=A0A834ZEV4_TETSI|nr:hypothetical protein HHK36_010398 [Tetracentron sinense]